MGWVVLSFGRQGFIGNPVRTTADSASISIIMKVMWPGIAADSPGKGFALIRENKGTLCFACPIMDLLMIASRTRLVSRKKSASLHGDFAMFHVKHCA